ncbi:MAG: helix-turn-helix domain-containing protein [Scytonema sp. PMC 1070.18]|nr:helix-turn-helix domain-containing protein [Scytonema sp. PMC 1070.18]
MTADEFFKLNANLKDAELRVYLYLMVLNPFPNSLIEIDTAKISEQLGLTRRTVQRAIRQLCELQLIEVEITKFKYKKAVHGASSRLGSGDTQIVSNDIRIASNDTRIASNDIRIASSDTRIASNDTRIANTHLKPLPNQGSSSSQISQTYSNFIQTLSEAQRESFLKFGEEKARKLPKPPELIEKWVEKHWEEISREWYKSNGKTLSSVQAAQNEKWANHPKREEWLAQIRQGKPAFIVKGGPKEERKIREEFTKWAEVNNLVWGTES